MKVINNIKLVALYLSVFSIQIADYNPFNFAGITPNFILCLLYILFAIPIFYNKYSIVNKGSKSLILNLVLLYFYIVFISLINEAFTITDNFNVIIKGNFSFSVLLFIFLVVEFYDNNRLIKRLLIFYSLSTLIIAGLVYFEVGKEMLMNENSLRLSFLGMNPNQLGQSAVVSTSISLVFLLKEKTSLLLKIFLLLTIFSTIIIVEKTASRGAFFTLGFMGICIPLVLFRGWKKIIIIPVVFVASLYISNYLLRDGSFLEKRIERSDEDGMGGRINIWSAAIEIFQENPLFGVGTTGYAEQTGKKLGASVDTHNVYLYFLVIGGLVGFVIFFVFVYRLIILSTKIFLRNKDPLSLIILLLLLFAFTKSGGVHSSRDTYFYFAVVTCWSINQLRKNDEENNYFGSNSPKRRG